MDSIAPPLTPGTATPSHREQLLPEGDPARELVFRPVEQSLSKVHFCVAVEINLALGFLVWLGLQPLWPDFRLILCQAGLLGSAGLILYGSMQWSRLFHSIDWTVSTETIQSTLQRMRDIRLQQLGWMAVLLPLILASGTPLLIQHMTASADEPWSSVFTALEPWPPLLLLAVIVGTVLMWRFTQRGFQDGWATRHLTTLLVDGGSISLFAQALTDLGRQETPADLTPAVTGSGDQTVLSPHIAGERGSPARETAPSSATPKIRAGHVPMLDAEERRESILEPVQRKLKQTVFWPLIEIVVILALLLVQLVFWPRWPDPRMRLCLAVGIVSGVGYVVFHTLWLRGVFRLDWNGPLEKIQTSLDRLRTMRLRHLRWSPVIFMPVS